MEDAMLKRVCEGFLQEYGPVIHLYRQHPQNGDICKFIGICAEVRIEMRNEGEKFAWT